MVQTNKASLRAISMDIIVGREFGDLVSCQFYCAHVILKFFCKA